MQELEPLRRMNPLAIVALPEFIDDEQLPAGPEVADIFLNEEFTCVIHKFMKFAQFLEPVLRLIVWEVLSGPVTINLWPLA
jgi:hypothetical protein